MPEWPLLTNSIFPAMLKSISTLLFVFAIITQSYGQTDLGSLKILTTEGDVIIRYDSSADIDLAQKGMILTEGVTILAGAESQTMIALSNGSILHLTQDSSLTVSQLRQEPHTRRETYDRLKEDPTTSTSLFKLNYGNVITHVKYLRPTSTFRIDTPVGAARILGTVASVTLTRNGNNVVMTVINVDGTVEVTNRSADGAFESLPAGQSVQISFDAATKTIRVETPVEISNSQASSLAQAVGEAVGADNLPAEIVGDESQADNIFARDVSVDVVESELPEVTIISPEGD